MFDYGYLLIFLLCMIISLGVQSLFNNTYRKYLGVYASCGMSGQEIAMRFLRENSIHDVQIQRTSGYLNDHYDSSSNIIRLSSSVYDNSSIASIAIACHEVGHAIQHNQGYVLLNLRNRLVPVVRIASSLSWICIFLGLFIGLLNLFLIGVIAFGVIALFHFVTLPIEIDASRRALKFLDDNYLSPDEHRGARSVLTAAALTYVAALVISLLQLFRFIFILTGGRRR